MYKYKGDKGEGNMLDFIEPSLAHRIEIITAENEQKHQEHYNEFDKILSDIKKYLPDHLQDAAKQLETMYIQRTDDVAPIYRIGFEDAIKLFKFFQNVHADEINIKKR